MGVPIKPLREVSVPHRVPRGNDVPTMVAPMESLRKEFASHMGQWSSGAALRDVPIGP
jgi:hypothetical protein